MKKYRVSKELKKYVRRVLIRSFYKYHFITDDEGQCWCVTNATSDAFHQIVQRAKCEKATEETGVFMVTAKERNNVWIGEREIHSMHWKSVLFTIIPLVMVL